jgi:signal transduction histidine kinase
MGHMHHRLAIIGRLGVGVAHDLEHDLRVIEESLRLLQWHGLSGEPKLACDQASDAARHAMRLTQCLLAYVRGESAPATRFDLPALVRRVLDRFGTGLGRGARLVVELDDGLPPVRASAGDLELLVLNALLYATDHVPEDGTIFVSAHRKNPRTVEFELSHSGRSSSRVDDSLAPDASVVDDPFLGVATTIAERHGARLQRMPRSGGGTRCVIAFPVDDEH